MEKHSRFNFVFSVLTVLSASLIFSACQPRLNPGAGPVVQGNPVSIQSPEATPPPSGGAALNLNQDSTTTSTNLVLDLTANSSSGYTPAALQWTLNYSTQDFSGISVSVGAASTAASKTVACNNGTAGVSKCLIYGMNTNLISNGVVAQISLTLNSGFTNQVSNLALVQCVSANPAGDAVLTYGGGLAVTMP